MAHLPQFHTIEHIVLHSVNFAMPALVKVTVEPMAKRMAFGIEISIEVFHHLALAFHVIQQVFITYCPGLQALM